MKVCQLSNNQNLNNMKKFNENLKKCQEITGLNDINNYAYFSHKGRFFKLFFEVNNYQSSQIALWEKVNSKYYDSEVFYQNNYYKQGDEKLFLSCLKEKFTKKDSWGFAKQPDYSADFLAQKKG